MVETIQSPRLQIDQADAPIIDVWYGKKQQFGHLGLAQRWVNILGRIRSKKPIDRLIYQLNGELPITLSIGPDHRRLSALGDFNIDIDHQHLKSGINQLEIVVKDVDGQQAYEEVLIDYVAEAGTNASLPRKIEWARIQSIQDVAQIVDGLWSLDGGVLSPVETGYDRLVGIGDMQWRDYEVVVPITVHAIDAACYLQPSVHAGVGIVLRWRGHTNWNTDSWTSGQPYCGPSNYGAIGWYCVFHDSGSELNFFDTEFKRPVRKPIRLMRHHPYWFKVRAQTVDSYSRFSLKVWAADTVEPNEWTLETLGTPFALPQGAFLLGAHHVAASFGNVEVREI
jgi:hypothetical protein